MADEITSLADSLHDHAQEHMPPEPVVGVASVTEKTVEVAGVRARWVSVIVSGHTVQQALFYEVAEAEAVHGRPFDEELDHEIQMAMFAVDRIWMDETMHKVASAEGSVPGEICIRDREYRSLRRHQAGQRQLGHYPRRRHAGRSGALELRPGHAPDLACRTDLAPRRPALRGGSARRSRSP